MADPVAEVRREHGRQMRQFAAQAHGVNLDLGWALRNELATVDPDDIDVARFFVSAALGSDYHGGYGKAGEAVVELAMTGIRLVLDDFRSDVTKTKKHGSRGVLRISYGEPQRPEDTVAWLWKFIDGGRAAGELYGRALVVIVAERHASRLVVPSSQQKPALRWPSRKDQAAKALAKVAGPCLPVSLKQLEKAIAALRIYEGIPLTQIAREVGTSVRMIELHYAGVIANWNGKQVPAERSIRAARAASGRGMDAEPKRRKNRK